MEVALFCGLWKSTPFSSRCAIAIDMFNADGDKIIVVDPRHFGALVESYRQVIKIENALLGRLLMGWSVV